MAILPYQRREPTSAPKSPASCHDCAVLLVSVAVGCMIILHQEWPSGEDVHVMVVTRSWWDIACASVAADDASELSAACSSMPHRPGMFNPSTPVPSLARKPGPRAPPYGTHPSPRTHKHPLVSAEGCLPSPGA